MFLDLIFPNRCLNCNLIIAANEVVCGICFEHIHFTHHNFDLDNELKSRCQLLFPVEKAYALMNFEDDSLSQKIVHQLKYAHREKIGKTLAEWTFERVGCAVKEIDLITNVPLHKKKLNKRGYNQLHLFTETLAKKLNLDFDHDLIKRNFHKTAQARKTKKQRTSTENLFSLNKPIENRHVLIIDDVYTTGNTMSAVAWEILKTKNNKVSVLVIAVD